MTELTDRAEQWIADDPDPHTRAEMRDLLDSGDLAEVTGRMEEALTFGTAGIRGVVGAGPGRMNRAVIIRTTRGLADHLRSRSDGDIVRPVVVGFDARPSSRQFAEDTVGVLAAAGIRVVYFSDVTPTPIVAFTAKHLHAVAAVVVTASHNPPSDNGYKVYGSQASQIVSPVDVEIQEAIETAPGASSIARIEPGQWSESALIEPAPEDIVDRYWDEVRSTRVRRSGSDLTIVYTPIHGVGGAVFAEVMSRAGHNGVEAVPEQAEPDGLFPTVDFPNPEEPGALDLAMSMARRRDADLIIANDPDADRLAVVIPISGIWRPLTGNETGVLLADYILRNDSSPATAIVASSIVSSPMLTRIARSYGAHHEQTLTGFKWIVKAGMELEALGKGRFVFGYEEALGYTVGATVRDKDGISAAVLFADLVADLADADRTIMGDLHDLWAAHGLWVSAQTSIVRPGPEGLRALEAGVAGLADDPPARVGEEVVAEVTDYRHGASDRPIWLGEQALVELVLESGGRILVRPSGTEPKLKIYVDLFEKAGTDPDRQHDALNHYALELGAMLGETLQI